MENLRLEDELLIQHKIDNTLTAHEEEVFAKLIETSQKARKFYQDLLEVSQLLHKDAKNGPLINFSKEILHRIIKNKNFDAYNHNKGKLIHQKFANKILSYAAILMVGLMVGSLAIYFARTNETPDKQMLAGTMSEKPAHYSVTSNGTEILLDEFQTDYLKLTTVAIETNETIRIIITFKNHSLQIKNINLLYSEGTFHLENIQNNQLTYSCNGTHVFQLNRLKSGTIFLPFTIEFQKNGTVLKKINFES